jgi:hypothetical protein
MSEEKMMSGQKEPKLPETPFNGVVTSVIRTDSNTHTYLHVAISDEDSSPERPVLAFDYFWLGSNLEPRGHLQEGAKVRVTKVEWSGKYVRAVEYDITQLASRKPSGLE